MLIVDACGASLPALGSPMRAGPVCQGSVTQELVQRRPLGCGISGKVLEAVPPDSMTFEDDSPTPRRPGVKGLGLCL